MGDELLDSLCARAAVNLGALVGVDPDFRELRHGEVRILGILGSSPPEIASWHICAGPPRYFGSSLARRRL